MYWINILSIAVFMLRVYTQTLTEGGGQFSSGAIVWVRVMVGGSLPQRPLSGLSILSDNYLFVNFELFKV